MELNREKLVPDALLESTASPAESISTEKVKLAHRFLALCIDSVIAWGAFGLLVWGSGYYAGYLLGALIGGGYYLVRDGLGARFMKQRSLGKKMVKIRPVRLDDKPMDLKTSIKRNWMFAAVFIGFLPFLGTFGDLVAFGIIVVVLYEGYKVPADPEGRRWGDELAGTQVIASAD